MPAEVDERISVRCILQALHSWKEGRRAGCVPLRVHLTYLTLPWWAIVNSILQSKDPPMLTF